MNIFWSMIHPFSFMKLVLLPSCFSRVRLCVTPQTAAHQALPSLGFSRQEHWSGLPFPSPTHESEKWKWSRSVVSNPQWPHGLQPTRLLRPWDSPGKSTGVGCHCLNTIKRGGACFFQTVWHSLVNEDLGNIYTVSLWRLPEVNPVHPPETLYCRLASHLQIRVLYT